jgi:uncharacterized protein YmfQ (DUF2313 family)
MSTATQQYRAKMLARLLPPGPAWTGGAQGNEVLSDVLLALAGEGGRFQDDADQLLEDFFPDTTVGMLPDWERVLRLSAGTLSDEQRRFQIISLLRGFGDPNVPNIQAAADAWHVGAVVDSHPYGLFRMGVGAMGDSLSGDGWVFTYTITYDSPRSLEFEAAMIALAPLHTSIVFILT